MGLEVCFGGRWLMELKTTRFNTINVDSEAIITFTQPIIGFQDFRRFITLPVESEEAMTWLQSTESGELAFLLMDPRQVMPQYKVKLNSHGLTALAVSSVDELEIYTLLVVPEDPSKVRTNLKAPVLINRKHRLGMQTVLENSNYPIQCFLKRSDSGTHEPQEVSNARSDA